MPSAASSVDFRAKFLKLFGYAVIAATVGLVAWGVMRVGGEMFSRATSLRCQDNLKTIAEAVKMYKEKYHNHLPPHMGVLLPLLDNVSGKFQCPSDPDKGRKGCRPAWLRRDDGDLFEYVELDGPSLDPKQASDRLPSSYLYVANGYPCGLANVNFRWTWREEFDRLRRQYGERVPMIRCYYHLSEQYLEDPKRPGVVTRDPDPDARPTFNITADLRFAEYPLDWRPRPPAPGSE